MSGAPRPTSATDAERRAFSGESARQLLTGLPRGGVDIAFEAVDRRRGDCLAREKRYPLDRSPR